MKHAVLFAVAAASALTLAACQRKEAAPEAAAPETTAAAAPEPAAPAAAPAATNAAAVANTGPIEPTPASTTAAGPPSTEALITGVTLTDMYQVQAGKIAEAKAQSPAVKDFGKTMVADHTAMTNQMKHVFAATKQKIPTELGARGKGMIDALNAASPEGFDKLYLSQQQAAQQAELALLQGYAEGGESADIKPAAAKAIPKVQAHLEKVNELQAAQK